MKQKKDCPYNFTQIEISFKELSRDVVCYFLDYKILSKRMVFEISKKFDSSLLVGKNLFVVHTCLRLEIYSFDGKIETGLNDFFVKMHGKMAIRRLLTLMCGMQSEILGEREIFGQIEKSIADSLTNDLLRKQTFWHLLELIEYARFLRNKYNINCVENYSSVGVNIFNKLIKEESKNISVIGNGYMSEFFFRKLDHKKSYKIFWINRNVEKAKNLQKNMNFLKNYKIVHVDIKESLKILMKSDFIFAALKNAEGLFFKHNFNYPKAIIDVSYPPIFSDDCNSNFYSIENTFFEKYIKHPVKKTAFRSCEKEIDKLFN